MNAKKINYSKYLDDERGSTILLSMLILILLSFLGVSAVSTTVNELKIASNDQAYKKAFYNADSGVQYVIGYIENDLKTNGGTTTLLPTSDGPTNAKSFTPGTPAGFSFTIFTIAQTTVAGKKIYSFTSTGTGTDNAKYLITSSFTRGETSAISFAAFGDEKSDTKNSGTTLSFDSSSTDPTKNNPLAPGFVGTGEADIGSNDWLVTHNGATIDGDGVLGAKDDNSATTNQIHGGTTFSGTAPVNAGRIDPDPLGINTAGGMYNPLTYVASNDNALASVGNTINTNGTVTLVGKPGGANYYFTSITLKNGANLNIDTSLGPVNIFLNGTLEAKNGSNINVLGPSGPGKATDFAIFSNSTANNGIVFKHNSEFRGLVYAPLTDVEMKNSSAVYGSIWGKTIDIKNSGTLYYDTALKNKYKTVSNDLTLSSWQSG